MYKYLKKIDNVNIT